MNFYDYNKIFEIDNCLIYKTMKESGNDVKKNYDDKNSKDKTIEGSNEKMVEYAWFSKRSNNEPFLCWSALPPLVIEKIYTFLNRKDQSRMSSVCRKWSQELSAPGLWRTIQYVFSDYAYSREMRPEVRWTRKYGHMFRHIEIICKTVKFNLETVILQQFQEFLHALSIYSQLSTLAFIDLGKCLAVLDETALEDMIHSIINFLWTQNKLTSVEFRNSNFVEDEAIKVLTAICVKNGKTLKTLKLEGFIFKSEDNSITCKVIDAHPFYDILMNLQEMLLDYSLVFENIIIECFHYACSLDPQRINNCLETMEIICDGSSSDNYRGVPPEAWKYFRTACPALKIDLLYHTGSSTRNEIDVFVVRHMPIRTLNLRWIEFNAANNENRIGSLLNYIMSCDCNALLEVLTIMWPHNNRHFVRDLIIFLGVCPKLAVLTLYIRHPIEELDMVFKWWLENGIMSLEEAHLIIENVQTVEGIINYTNLADEYAPLLLELGLNFSFEVNYV